MNEALQEKVELMARNYRVVHSSAKMSFQAAAHLGALLFTANNAEANEDAIRANRKLLRKRASVFSNLRGASTNIAVLANMCMSKNPNLYLEQVIEAYNVIKAEKVLHDEGLVFAALNMVERVSSSQYEEAAENAWALYDKMKEAHPLLTSQNDLTLALLLSQADLDADHIMDEAEACFARLKSEGFVLNKDTVQSISMILALSDKPVEQKCADFLALRAALKKSGHKIKSIEQAVIAAFVDLDVPVEQIASEIAEADSYLKQQKGFGALGCGAQLRRLIASALVLQVHDEQAQDGAVVASKSVASIVTQQIVLTIIMIIVITATMTAARSAAN